MFGELCDVHHERQGVGVGVDEGNQKRSRHDVVSNMEEAYAHWTAFMRAWQEMKVYTLEGMVAPRSQIADDDSLATERCWGSLVRSVNASWS